MVNINIQLPETLHKELKVTAISNDKTLKDLINEVLEQVVRQQ